MELEGLKRCLRHLKEIPIKEIVTDRHSQIRTFMKAHHSDIKHTFDVWHINKGKIIVIYLYTVNPAPGGTIFLTCKIFKV